VKQFYLSLRLFIQISNSTVEPVDSHDTADMQETMQALVMDPINLSSSREADFNTDRDDAEAVNSYDVSYHKSHAVINADTTSKIVSTNRASFANQQSDRQTVS
jgi:hypothetical protein